MGLADPSVVTIAFMATLYYGARMGVDSRTALPAIWAYGAYMAWAFGFRLPGLASALGDILGAVGGLF